MIRCERNTPNIQKVIYVYSPMISILTNWVYNLSLLPVLFQKDIVRQQRYYDSNPVNVRHIE